MEDAKLDQYKKIIAGINKLQAEIRGYLHGNVDVGGKSYGEALRELSRLRNLQRSTSKEVRERYQESKRAYE